MKKKVKANELLEGAADLPGIVFHDTPEKGAVPTARADGRITSLEADQVRRLLAETARRQIEALRLYQPLPEQNKFHASMAPERILRGSNRGGKTLPAAVEVARAACGRDPYGKWPLTEGRFFCVGKDGRHVSQVMWRKLSRANAFKMIRDQNTGLWRAFMPWDLLDKAREQEAKSAPPLIPPRMIADIAWIDKKAGQPNLVKLINGWELVFFSSEAKPPNGVDVDGVWFDEEILDLEWYDEMAARLLDRRGRFIWSATPQAGTEQLYQLHERAVAQQGEDAPAVTEHVILLEDNPHISESEKKAFREKLSDLAFTVRYEGQFALLSFRVFPEWNPVVHKIPYQEIPANWTRWVAIDPGRQVCAAIFAAVPPPDVGDYVYFYDELYIKGCDAGRFGTEMRFKCMGQNIHAFIIDHTGSRVHETASGRTIEDQYSDALKANKVSSLMTGSDFLWASNDVKSGVEASRAWLRTRQNGTCKLRVVEGQCKNFEDEIKMYRYKRIKGQTTDEPESRGRVHTMACLRYLAMHGIRWVKPPEFQPVDQGAVKALKAKQQRMREKMGASFVNLGPSIPKTQLAGR